MHIQTFPKSKAALNSQYRVAIIYLNEKKLEKALTGFRKVANQKPEDQELHKGALYYAIYTLKTIDKTKTYPPLPKINKVTKPIPIPKGKLELIEACDLFTQSYPKDERTVPIKYEAARIYLKFGHYKKAVERLESLGITASHTEEGKMSLRMVLAYFYENNNKSEFISRAQKYVKVPAISKNKKFKDEIEALLMEVKETAK